ncbi:MAG: polyprenyl synthetase family protein [Bacteroidales bacterium]|nr:polyprenyl synthetase family protein [Bacteroidales bacterium]MDD3301150.1 polyprenyl synthetase family protein [Bacteroidales bacterium]MDD3844412.1 polyprenyl synthetase family protein [Bacteroidales bacterium]MDD4618371.1 polyprenyl synthetase family protein [Bacteroidales bacterium]
MFSISEIDALVEKGIFSLDLKGEPVELYNPIEYLVSIGGKRLRPKLAILSYNLFSDKIDRSIIYPAMGLEIFHGFTLIHDDIMDNADLRRNRTTVHKKWNNSIAILSGDVMCIKSYKYMSMAPAAKLKEVLDLFSETAEQVCEGQQYDMNFETSPLITMDEYLSMIGLKTAVLIAASAKVGAIIANAPATVCDALYNYAYQLGLAFQIKDDYFDSFGDPSTFGKKIGGDILCGKKTWLLVESLKRAGGGKRTELQEIIKNKTLDHQEKIDKVLEIYLELGIKEAAEDAMDLLHKKALDFVKDCGLTKEQKERLHEFAGELINREK